MKSSLLQKKGPHYNHFLWNHPCCKRNHLGCVCATRGICSSEENCSDFPGSPFFVCLVRHIFLVEKEIMNQFSLMERILFPYVRGRKVGFLSLSLSELEICREWNPLAVQVNALNNKHLWEPMSKSLLYFFTQDFNLFFFGIENPIISLDPNLSHDC